MVTLSSVLPCAVGQAMQKARNMLRRDSLTKLGGSRALSVRAFAHRPCAGACAFERAWRTYVPARQAPPVRWACAGRRLGAPLAARAPMLAHRAHGAAQRCAPAPARARALVRRILARVFAAVWLPIVPASRTCALAHPGSSITRVRSITRACGGTAPPMRAFHAACPEAPWPVRARSTTLTSWTRRLARCRSSLAAAARRRSRGRSTQRPPLAEVPPHHGSARVAATLRDVAGPPISRKPSKIEH